MVNPRSARPLKRQQGKRQTAESGNQEDKIFNQASRKGISEMEGKAAR
jgi:hypothetical protein